MSDFSGSRARHVAIIMDGNGRWAKRRGLPRALGHRRGVEAVRKLVRAVEPLGIDCLTLYAFSSENWKRPEDEIDHLMGLLRRFIESDLPEFIANDVRLKIIGDYRALAPDIVDSIEDAIERTSGGKRILAVALNYGSQQEIARAAALAAQEGEVSEASIARHLYTARGDGVHRCALARLHARAFESRARCVRGTGETFWRQVSWRTTASATE